MNWHDETITSAVARAARARPSSDALVQHDQRVTYKELIDKAAQLATGMGRMGVRSGDHIAVLYPNNIGVQIVHLASACLGTVYVPLNVMLGPDELSYLLLSADITTLFVGGKYRDTNLIDLLLKAIPELNRCKGSELVLPKFPKLKRIIQIADGPITAPGLIPFESVMKNGATNPLPFVNTASKPENISHLLYTSGSTATPKGVLLTQRGVVGASYLWGEALALTSNDHSLALMPFYHTGGLFISSLPVLLRGGYVCMFEKGAFDAKEALEIIQRERVTVAAGFDPQVQAILEHPDRSQYDLSSLQKLLNFTKSAYDRRTAEGIPLLVGFYALTEGSNPVSAVMPNEKNYAVRRDSNGPALPGVELKIVDSNTGEKLPPGTTGEIAFRGWNRFAGYYKPGPNEVAEKVFDADGFFRTGDLGYLDADGNLYFMGRSKDLIKTGGENVSPLEIENFLTKEFPGIVLAQVVGVPDTKWGETVTAFVEAKPAFNYTAEEIIKKCKAHLSAFKVPKNVVFVKPGKWPTSPTAKIRKNDLRQIAAKALTKPG
jgi:fatty-acyl-CoA synthase